MPSSLPAPAGDRIAGEILETDQFGAFTFTAAGPPSTHLYPEFAWNVIVAVVVLVRSTVTVPMLPTIPRLFWLRSMVTISAHAGLAERTTAADARMNFDVFKGPPKEQTGSEHMVEAQRMPTS